MLKILKKQLVTGEMYVNNYAKRVANNNAWKIPPQREFLTKNYCGHFQKIFMFQVLLKMHLTTGKIRKLMFW